MRYGPYTPAVEGFIEQVSILTEDEALAIRSACAQHKANAGAARWTEMTAGLIGAAFRTGRKLEFRAAYGDTKDALKRATRQPIWIGLAEVSQALVVRDEVGEETVRWFRVPWDAVMDRSKVTPVPADSASG